jgi:hypothetical protein
MAGKVSRWVVVLSTLAYTAITGYLAWQNHSLVQDIGKQTDLMSRQTKSTEQQLKLTIQEANNLDKQTQALAEQAASMRTQTGLVAKQADAAFRQVSIARKQLLLAMSQMHEHINPDIMCIAARPVITEHGWGKNLSMAKLFIINVSPMKIVSLKAIYAIHIFDTKWMLKQSFESGVRGNFDWTFAKGELEPYSIFTVNVPEANMPFAMKLALPEGARESEPNRYLLIDAFIEYYRGEDMKGYNKRIYAMIDAETGADLTDSDIRRLDQFPKMVSQITASYRELPDSCYLEWQRRTGTK